MRLLAVLLLALTLVGCSTASRTTRSAYSGSSAYAPMIIRNTDIEPSIDAAVKSILPIAVSAGARQHTVRAGETLWSISKQYGVDVAALAQANSISDSRSIEAGQVLKIPSAAQSLSARRSTGFSSINYSAGRTATFIWPVNGCIGTPFGAKIDTSVNKGVDIRATDGANVLASRGGKVVFCDPYLKGFGQTVIIDHMDGYQTVYSYNSDILVKVGDLVDQRQAIARVGSSGRAEQPMLHFEIRKNGEPQNPEFYLSRSR